MNYLQVDTQYGELVAKEVTSKVSKSDCFPRSLSVATGISLRTSYSICRDVFKREDGKGTSSAMINEVFAKAEKEGGLELDGKTFKIRKCNEDETKNLYKVKGEVIARKKTLKSFIQSNQKGTFIVLVAKHALVVEDGKLLDWKGMAFLPTRKVLEAFEVKGEKVKTGQLEFDFA